MAAMAIASFPFASIFSEPSMLPPHPYGHVRADLSTDGAPGAFAVTITPTGEEISLSVNLFSNPNQLLRTGDRAKTATLTAFSINLNLRHSPHPETSTKSQASNPK
jgi:hypothetical protein